MGLAGWNLISLREREGGVGLESVEVSDVGVGAFGWGFFPLPCLFGPFKFFEMMFATSSWTKSLRVLAETVSSWSKRSFASSVLF